MKLLLKEYLSSLKERGELDAILPDLLSENGFSVYSRPTVGVRQYGVDIAAIGNDNGEDKVFLFTVKQGDISRSNWDDNTDQSLRKSLGEILDGYIPTRIPPEHSDKKIVICITAGGEIKENVKQQIVGYQKERTTNRISFQEWDGERIAQFILDGPLNVKLLPNGSHDYLRKAVAMSEEPEICFQNFSHLVDATFADAKNDNEKIRASRIILISLWVIYAWAREAGNLDGAHKCSEYAALQVWQNCKQIITDGRKSAERIGYTFGGVIDLYFDISEILLNKAHSYNNIPYGLSLAVRSWEYTDINLRLFDLLGKLSTYGLWLLWMMGKDTVGPKQKAFNQLEDKAVNIAKLISNIIEHNSALFSPVSDEQAVEIVSTVLFLRLCGNADSVILTWMQGMASKSIFAYKIHGKYPCVFSDYKDLLTHPRHKSEAYREEATSGSVLYPSIALIAAFYEDTKTLIELKKFKSEDIRHCTLQLWLPDEESEKVLYSGGTQHGIALTDIPIDGDPDSTIKYIQQECEKDKWFENLSAISLGHWPLLIMACRQYRLPIPPQLIIQLFSVKDKGHKAAN